MSYFIVRSCEIAEVTAMASNVNLTCFNDFTHTSFDCCLDEWAEERTKELLNCIALKEKSYTEKNTTLNAEICDTIDLNQILAIQKLSLWHGISELW